MTGTSLSKGEAAQQGHRADALQLTLRFSFRARLRPSVDMTSDVKGWEPLFYVCLLFSPSLYRKSRSQEDPTVEHAALRGLAPPFLASVGCLPPSRDERTSRSQNAAEGDTPPGRRLCRGT